MNSYEYRFGYTRSSDIGNDSREINIKCEAGDIYELAEMIRGFLVCCGFADDVIADALCFQYKAEAETVYVEKGSGV